MRTPLGKMKPLIDADILAYECAFGAETGWEGEDPPPFDIAREMLETRIANICALVGATEPYQLYLTGEGNFREKIATLKPYKANRVQEKPFHYKSLRAYMVGVLDAIVVHGMEADDYLNIEQRLCMYSKEVPTIICSRDKDLRIADGWLYSWEVGKQPSFGPDYNDGYGWLDLINNNKKLMGRGTKYFLAQCLMGDSADNIGGLPKYGPALAYKMLNETETYKEGLDVVYSLYKAYYGREASNFLLENGRLLWLTSQLDKKMQPVLWEHHYE